MANPDLPEGAHDFSAFIADRTRAFTGRNWVFSEVDAWLADRNLPTFLIIAGEPGVGKSAIAARLTQIRDVAAGHFCIARNADTIDPALFARSLSLQLCRIDGFAQRILKDSNIDVATTQNIQANYGQVVGAKINNLIVNAPSGSVAFVHTVLQPLKSLFADGYDRQLLLLVDGLDEAVQHKGPETIVDLLANAIGLPSQVRFVLTSRPDAAVWRQFEARQIPHFRIDAKRPENLGDIRDHIRREVQTSDAIRNRLAEQSVDAEDFLDRVVRASDGNFLYVVWLLPAIAAGTQRFDTAAALPQGLDSIYREFLRTRRTRDEARWRTVYEPILGVLAAAQEPLSRDLVARLTSLTTQEARYGLQDLYQFMDPADADGGRYFLYHQSISDWLVAESRAQEFWIDLESAHRRIVEHYRGTAHSWDAVDWRHVDEYGLRHLAKHLYALPATGTEQLYGLICRPYMREKYRRTLSHRAFAEDVALMIRVAERNQSPNVAQLVRGCLLYSSLGFVASKVTPETLGLLARLGNDDAARDYAALIQDRWQQCQAYLEIGEVLQSQQRQEAALEVAEQAAAVASGISDDSLRSEALAQVAVSLAQAGGHQRATQLVTTIATERLGAGARVALVSALVATRQVSRALSLAEPLKYNNRIEALTNIIRGLVEAEDLPEARRVRNMIEREPEGYFGADEVVEALAAREQFDDAIREIGLIRDRPMCDRSLARLALAISRAGDHERALATAATIADPHIAMSALGFIAETEADAGNLGSIPKIVEIMVPEKARALDIADQTVRSAATIGSPDQAFVHLAVADVMSTLDRPADALTSVEKAMAAARRINDYEAAAEIWGECAELFADLGQEKRAIKAARQALRAARRISESSVRSDQLLSVAQAMSSAGLADEGFALMIQLRDEAATSEDASDSIRILANVAAALPQFEKSGRAITVINEIYALVARSEGSGRENGLAKIASTWLQVGERGRAAQIVTELLSTIRAAPNSFPQTQLFAQLADLKSRFGEQAEAARILYEAGQLAAELSDHSSRAMVLGDLVSLSWQIQSQGAMPFLDEIHLGESTMLLAESALQAARRVEEDLDAVGLMCDLAVDVHKSPKGLFQWSFPGRTEPFVVGVLNAALERADASADQYARSLSLAHVAATLTQTGDHIRAKAAIETAQTAAIGLPDPTERAMALAGAARTVANIAWTRMHSPSTIHALLVGAQAFGRAGEHDAAARTAKQTLALIVDSPQIDLTEALAAMGLSGRLSDALEIGAQVERKQRGFKGTDNLFGAIIQHLYPGGSPSGSMSIRTDGATVAGASRRLARAHAVDDALKLAGKIRDDADRTTALVEIAQTLTATDATEQARDLLYQVLAFSGTLGEERYKMTALCCLAEAFAESAQPEKAWAVVERIRPRDIRRNAMTRVGGILARNTDFPLSMNVPESVGGSVENSFVLCRIAEELVDLGQNSRALEIANDAARAAEQAVARGDRLMILLGAALIFARVGELSRASGITDRALSEIENNRFASNADKAGVGIRLLEVFGALKESRKLAHVVDLVVATFENAPERVRSRTVRDLARKLTSADHKDVLERMTNIALAIRSRRERVNALGGVVEALAGAGEADAARVMAEQALTVAIAIKDERDRMAAVDFLTRSVVREGHPALSATVIDRLERMPQDLGDEHARVAALRTKAWALERLGCHEDSMAALHEAFVTGRLVGRAETLGVLGDGARTLAREDGGLTLWSIYQALQEVDGWWSTSSSSPEVG